MRSRRDGFLAVALLAGILAMPCPARAGAPPDSAGVARLRAGRWNRFRVITDRSQFEITTLRTDSIGVVLQAAPRRPSVVQTADAGRDAPRRVTWSEIERIEATRSHMVKGMGEGALIGGLVGLTATLLIVSSVHDESALGAIGVTPLGVIFGGLAGATFGGSSGWHPLYP